MSKTIEAGGTPTRLAHRLSPSAVRALKAPSKYNDGNGLMLIVVTPERRGWHYRYWRDGKERLMSLGDADEISLAEARRLHIDARTLLARGIDPLDQRREQGQPDPSAPKVITFVDAARDYIGSQEAGWRNPKHRQQWRNTLATYANPVIGKRAVNEIDVNAILEVLRPIWKHKPETASRVRGRVETILDYSKARGWRDGPNPAIWRGNLKLMLPSKERVHQVKHHPSLDWREAPVFMAQLREHHSMGARALQFAILTAARNGEVRGVMWDEIDLNHAVWTIPGSRMKAKRPHRVPLSEPAVVLLRQLATMRDGSGLMFIGLKRGALLSDMTMTAVLRRMGRHDVTVHGFRPTFRTWAAEASSYPEEVVKAALAHAIGDKVDAAYQRGDLFAKRAALMDEWAEFLAQPAAEVVSVHPGAGKHPHIPKASTAADAMRP